MLNILHKSVEIIQEKCIPVVSKKHLQLFRFGIASLTLSPFRSLNSNARITINNIHTAYTKMYRLTKQKKLLLTFPHIMQSFDFVHPDSLVVIDFSTFCGFQVLTFAVQTHLGRAIPVHFEIITYPIVQPTSQNIFIQDALKHLKEILGFYPCFVLDRGFAIPTLIEFFVQNQILFYVRAKKGKGVTVVDKKREEHTLPASMIKNYDTSMKAYGFQLRLIISNKPKDKEEPWYIITNDFDSSRKEIISIYYHRFEIEETFKDLKHVFDLKIFRIKTMQSFSIVLWFAILGVWLSFSIDELKLQIKKLTEKQIYKKVSIVRLWSEGVQRSFLYSFFNTSYMKQFF